MRNNYSDVTPGFVTNDADTSAPQPQIPEADPAREEEAIKRLDIQIFKLSIKRERELEALQKRSQESANQNFQSLKVMLGEN